MKKVVAIAAIQDIDNGIGYDEDLLYHIKEDLQRFKKLTNGSNIIMGSKTFLTFPKPLPNRTHYVMTRDIEKSFKGVITVNSFTSALAKIKDGETGNVIGGGEVYKQTMPYIDVVELTRIKGNKSANIFFPNLKKYGFYMTHVGQWKTDLKTKVKFRFEKWKPVKPTFKEKIYMFFKTYK